MEEQKMKTYGSRLMLFNKGRKVSQASKTKQGTNLLLPISRQKFSHLLQSMASVHIEVPGKTNAVTSNTPLSPPLPELLFLSTPSYAGGYPSGQLGAAALTVSPHNFLCTPSLLS